MFIWSEGDVEDMNSSVEDCFAKEEDAGENSLGGDGGCIWRKSAR